MRNTALAVGLVIGCVFHAGGSQAANLQSYARVNLVQGTEVMMTTPDVIPVDNFRFTLSGPSNFIVSLQMATLGPESQWWDNARSVGVQVDSHHDSGGMLCLDDPFEVPLTKNPVTSPTRLIISVVYE